ncbi:MAG: POTRA domain-containing protein, partial [Bacteroidia bacterium]
MPKYFYLFLIGLCFTVGKAQEVRLKIIFPSSDKWIKNIGYKQKLNTKEAAYKEINSVIFTLQQKGYLLAAIDTLYNDTSSVTAVISENKPFKWAYLKLGNLNPSLASKLGISEKLYFNKAFRYNEMAKSINKIITWYENNGYPFASVKLDSVETNEDQVKAVLNVEKNKFFKIDSVKIQGNARINKKFLYRYLSIKESMPYNEVAIASISQKIKQLPFVFEKQPQIVRLTNKTNKLVLFLDKKNASQFDGIIGLLPDAATKKTVITGDVKLKVVNGIFRNGETFDLQWRRLQSQTQDFKGNVIYPYLFGTPAGVDYALKIYKRDTTFIDINNNFGLQYYFSGLNYLKVFYKQRTSNLISTSGLNFVTTLPDYADISTQSYGAGILFEKLNYRFNPHKGISLSLNA